MKKFGGVKISLERVTESDVCPGCGRTAQACSDWWDKELGVTGHASDTGAKSEYVANLRKQRDAIIRGLDPYCFQAGLRAMGYTPNWTPRAPSGSLVYSPTQGAKHGKGSQESSDRTRGRSKRSRCRKSRGSGR